MRARHGVALVVLGALIGSCGNQDQAPQPAPSQPEEKVAVSVNELGSSITLNASSSGAVRFYKTGGTCGTNTYALTGYEIGAEANTCSAPDVYRAYFIFNLSGIQHASATTPTSATLSIGNTYAGMLPQTVNFSSYTGTPTASSASFSALNGNAYGSVSTGTSPPATFTYALNATGLSAVQGKLGSASITIAATYGSESTASTYFLKSSATPTLALVLTCDAGYADCNGGTDGCETNITTSANNCGACGTVCSNNHIASPTCASSVCNGTCSAGYLDCNSNKQSDGCEKQNTDTSCGCSATTCTTSQTCNTTTGACTACGAGTMDCNTNAADACEKTVNTNASCGTTCTTSACGASQTCNSGACTNCAAGTLDCDATPGVCEKTVNTNANCGTTCANGVACSAVQTCTSGACTACATGTQDCDATPGVCEKTNSRTDCGCGHTVCGASQTCTNGVCTNCGANTLDCNSTAADGCETATDSVTSCGTTCGNVTSCNDNNACTTDTCSAGACGHTAGNPGGVCRAINGACDVAETCPPLVAASNVDTTQWSDFGSAPNWNCTASGTTTVDSSAGTVKSTSCTLTTGYTLNSTITLATSSNDVAQTDATGPDVMVVRLSGLTVTSNHVLKLTGDKPIIFLVQGNVTVNTGGKIDASASGVTNGPGGGAATLGALCSGLTGGDGGTASSDGGGGGGGGFGTAGGLGGASHNNSGSRGAAGSAGGNATLVPLRGGCAGGKAGLSDHSTGGGAGGAFQISASGTITIGTSSNTAYLVAAGAGGLGQSNHNGAGGDGGGSGGAILLEAPAMPSIGTNGGLRVHGGGGGGGIELGSSDPGVDGHQTDDTAAAGGQSEANLAQGGNGGLCRGSGCSQASAVGQAGEGTSSYSGEGGGGGGGRVLVQTKSSSGGTCPADTFLTAGTVCRALVASPSCDIAAETCSGSSAACPADTVKAAGTSCRASAGICDIAESCDGTNPTCPTDAFQPSTSVCRSIASACDLVAETCTGTGAACPADAGFAPNTTVCRASAGACDVDDKCTGSSGACPADAFAASSTVCRSSTGVCDPAENCTGSATACPADVLSPSTTTCRGSTGACDIAENCTGSAAACPTDALVSAGTVCRPIASSCDLVAETCTGGTGACPADASFAAAGTTCRAAIGSCDIAESCSGSTGSCPANTFVAGGTVCRASAGTCDVAESCSGSAGACPGDTLVANGTVCRAIAGTCDSAAETCNGSNPACPADTSYASSTTVCRNQTGICDAAEFCTGSSTVCPGDAYAPAGTDCGYNSGANAATIYTTGLPSGTNANTADFATAPAGWTTNASNPSSAALAAPATASGWGSDAYKFAVTAPASANYDYWRWVAGNGTASGSSRTLQAADMIEYDVYVDTNADGIGGIDIKTNHSSTATTGCTGSCDYFRGWSAWQDQNSLSGHPSTNISSQAYRKWYHRRLAVPSGMVGSTITYFDVVDENNSSGSRAAYYDNLIISQTAGSCDGANVCKIKENAVCSDDADCSSGICDIPSKANLVHRYDFIGSGTTASDSIGTSDGTVTNTTLGNTGTVVLAGGTSDQYVNLPNHILNTLTDASIEVWFVWSSSANAWQRVFDFGDTTGAEGSQGTGDSYLFFTPSNGSVARVEYLKTSAGTKYGVNASSALTTGTLHQVVVVFDTSVTNYLMTLYIDGSSVGSVAMAGNGLNLINDINNWLGRSQFNDAEFAGTIYDFRLYNKALSAAEVSASYAGGSETECFAPLAAGSACAANNQCVSSFCVDAKCCNNACGGGSTIDCQACDVGGHVGTCWPQPSGTVCRTSQGTCDVSETCDGTSTACPIDTQ